MFNCCYTFEHHSIWIFETIAKVEQVCICIYTHIYIYIYDMFITHHGCLFYTRVTFGIFSKTNIFRLLSK